MLNIFIGFDPNETVAWHVLANSIQRRASIPVAIAPLMRSQLKGLYRRSRGPTESTEFSLTRFLVPALSQYRGWSLFMDCDMLCLADVAEIAALAPRSSEQAVLVCKHDYTPKTARKFLDHVQTKYPRKNWSSLMFFNNERCTALTPEYVNTATGLDLHRFRWLDDALIGELPLEWNWLVGEYERIATPKMVHYTLGGPYFEAYRNCDYAAEWREELRLMNYAADSRG